MLLRLIALSAGRIEPSVAQVTGRTVFNDHPVGADILVNSAGVLLTAPFSSDQRREHRRMVETNLLGR